MALFASVLAVTVVGGCSNNDASFEVLDADPEAVVDHGYEIPAGAGQALDAGTPLEIFPPEFQAQVGQTLEIVNLDDRGHLVGPWFVGAGETLRQTFASPGTFIGECTVHPSGQIVVNIFA